MPASAGDPSPLVRATPLLTAVLVVLTGLFWFTGGNLIGCPAPAAPVSPPAATTVNESAAQALRILMDRPPGPGQETPEGTRHDLGETAFGAVTTLTVRTDGKRVVTVQHPTLPVKTFGTIMDSRGVRVIVNGPLEGAFLTITPDGWTVTFPGI